MYYQLLFLFLNFYPFSSFFLLLHFFSSSSSLFSSSSYQNDTIKMVSSIFLDISLPFSCCCFSFLFSLFFHFRSSNLLSYSSIFFTIFLISVVQFQPSFPHSLGLLHLSLSSPWSPCSFLFLSKFLNFCLCFLFSSFFFSLLFLFFLFSFFFFPLLFFFVSQCDDFLNFPFHFLRAVLPAPALNPSLPVIAVVLKGALDNILKFSFWLNFI